jgi:hypothetical protein
MASLHIDLNFVLGRHGLHCDICRDQVGNSLGNVRRNGKDCSASLLWLACIGWAVPEQMEYSDLQDFTVSENEMTLSRTYPMDNIRIEVFQLSNSLAESFLSDKH